MAGNIIDKSVIGSLEYAVKYSQKKDNPHVIIEGYEDKDKIIYKVSDNGIGIDKKEHHKIFQLFKRMDNAQEFDGTGVGLSIVKRIMVIRLTLKYL